ncbi:MAG: DUF4255 domain-containing protein [Ktedonobacteraceae bacterium]
MSNYLAIATATAALSQLLYAAVSRDVNGATVTTVRPDAAANNLQESKVNVYLYQVTPNAALRNDDLPTRRADGTLAQRPRIALDLHYLLTFYGDEPTLVPQRLLGSTVRTLHSEPLLTRERILSITNPPPPPPNPYPYLSTSTLANDVELIKFTPQLLSLEELSKLWSVFLQTSYTLSIPYLATVVVIESEQTPQQVLPVQERRVYVRPFASPVITQVILAGSPATGPQSGQPIVAGSKVSILGTHLQGDVTIVRIGGEDVTPTAQDSNNAQIDVKLPTDLQAGVQSALVIQQVLMGKPPVPHVGFASNAVPFVLHPTITQFRAQHTKTDAGGLVSGDLAVTVDVLIGTKQQVSVLVINPDPKAPASYSFLAAPLTATGNTVTVPISGVKAAQYLVRIMVDGAESVLENDQKNGLLTLP